MKNNKKKLTIIVISIIAALLLITTGTIVYYVSNLNWNKTEDFYQTQTTTLSEEEKEIKRIEKELEKTNLMTYTIMRKYGKTTVTETIMDKRTDLDLIWVMCDMIENNEFTQDELTVIKKYINNRYNAINTSDEKNPLYDDEDELEYRIEELFNYEHRRDYIK